MGKKEILIELRQQVYDQLKDFMDSLDEAERSAVGSPEDWSIKDALVHVANWDERRGINLAEIARGEAPTDWGDFNLVNDREFEEHQHDTWEQVEALIDRSQQALQTGLQELDPSLLTRTGVLPGDTERTTWSRIVGTNIMHPVLHMTEYLVKQGQTGQALEIILEISDQLARLDEGDEWQGTQIYNKACYYALAGQAPVAIDLLGRSLQLNPYLVEWSKQDSDLDSLREEAAFQALYES